jgi:RNAse (barnase) inhibitor barstar
MKEKDLLSNNKTEKTNSIPLEKLTISEFSARQEFNAGRFDKVVKLLEYIEEEYQKAGNDKKRFEIAHLLYQAYSKLVEADGKTGQANLENISGKAKYKKLLNF